jgi:hypothetical protein
MGIKVLAVVIALFAVSQAEAMGATLHATPSTLTSVYGSAQGGDTILLASGSYSYIQGLPKPSMVTIKPETGASVSMSGSEFANGSSFTRLEGFALTAYNSVVGDSHDIQYVNMSFDGIDLDSCGGCYDGRLSLNTGATRVLVQGSHFGGGGCSDGIFMGIVRNVTITGNTFENLLQGSCGRHVDAIQWYGDAQDTMVDGNLFQHDETGIMEYDGGSKRTIAKNNAIRDITRSDECLILGGSQDATVEHNTLAGGCELHTDSKPGQQQTNLTLRNNVAITIRHTNGTPPSFLVNDYNLTTDSTAVGSHSLHCTPTFVGGANWSTLDGAALAPSSCGYHAGSDGESMGVVTAGGPPPPPAACADGVDNDSDGLTDYPADPGCSSASDTDETDAPVDHTPVAAFTVSPEPSSPGQQVTFDATSSTCADTPCTYHWHDIGPPNPTCATGTGDWGLGADGSVMTFTFQGTGTKCVELVLTDVDGDVSRVEHDHSVASGPPPDTTPPDTSILTHPTDPTTSNSSTFTFTGTDNIGVDHFECKVDAGSYVTCTSPRTYANESGLGVGTHTFSVRAFDAAGNVDATPASFTWTITAAGVTPPTFVNEAETSWTTTTSSKSVSLSVQAGDVLVAYGMSEDSANTLSISGNQSWTLRQSVVISGYANTYVWTATAASAGTASVTFNRTASSGQYGGDVLQFRGSSGIGASAKRNTTGTPSLDLTTTSANSAIAVADSDWTAVPGGSRQSRSVNGATLVEKTYNNSTAYTVYGGYYASAGPAGVKTVGWTAPSQKYSIAAVEVKGV